MKIFFLLTFVITGLLLALFLWNSYFVNAVIYAPAANQAVGLQYQVSGKIPSTWLNEKGFGLEIQDSRGIVMSQLVFLSRPWWGKYIAVPLDFSMLLDTSGMTNETQTCYGKAILLVYSLENENLSFSTPIDCAS
jgi:hypothetical protein